MKEENYMNDLLKSQKGGLILLDPFAIPLSRPISELL